jgi:hypothetical protein
VLLYDRLRRWARAHRYTPQDEALVQLLDKAQVFELSNLVPLLPDWERGREAPVSKRPPYDVLWGEWQYDDPGPAGHEHDYERWDMGVVLCRLGPDEVAWSRDQSQAADHQPAPPAPLYAVMGAGPIQDDFWTCEEFYGAQGFMSLRRAGSWTSVPSNQLCWQAGRVLFGMRDGGTIVRTTAFIPGLLVDPQAYGLTPDAWRALMMAQAPLRLPMLVSIPRHDRYWPFRVPWPLLMSCALLHCKNVTAEQVDPTASWSQTQRRKAQRLGQRPPVAHHVLRLHLPQEHHLRTPAPQEAAGHAGVRFHLCRGHFKHLTHPRYKEPGLYWWPAHWRGDPALGVTLKDYALEPAP